MNRATRSPTLQPAPKPAVKRTAKKKKDRQEASEARSREEIEISRRQEENRQVEQKAREEESETGSAKTKRQGDQSIQLFLLSTSDAKPVSSFRLTDIGPTKRCCRHTAILLRQLL